jgi:putative thioredoxin
MADDQAQQSKQAPKKDPTAGIGISLAGAVDLSSVKHHVSAKPGQAGGAPQAGRYVIDVTASSFQAVAQSSQTYPVLLYIWVPDDDRLFDFTRQLQDAVNKLNGKVQLARIDMKKYPEIAQTLGLRGAPALVLLLAGRAIPVTQGLPSAGEMQQILQVVEKIPQLATRAGVTGTAPKMGSGSSDDAKDGAGDGQASAEQKVPPEHQKAYELAQKGDYSGAALEYKKVLDANPQDHLAARERAKALLLARSGQKDVKAVREAGAAKPDDEDAQLAVADIDMIGGQVEDAFGRLLDFAAAHRTALNDVRKRLLSYFDICDADDQRVARARRRLATLMF